MKKIATLILKSLAIAGLVFLVSGCAKKYNTAIGERESIGKDSPVTIDGHSSDGKVTRVYVDTSGHRMAEFTVGSVPLRQGTVRIRGQQGIDLRSGKPDAEILPAGASIPVESQVAFIAHKWIGNRSMLIGVTVIVAAICLICLLAFRTAARLVPIIAAVGLARTTAYYAHGFAVPAVQELQAKIHSTTPAPTANSAPTATDGWTGKIRNLENQIGEFLGTPEDAPNVLAFLAIFLIALPIYAISISWFVRKLRCQPVVCGLMLLVCLPSALRASPDQTGVQYSLGFLEQEQKSSRQSLSEIQANLETASHLLDAHLPGAPEHLVRALFQSDVVDVHLEGELDRIAQISHSFRYIRSEEQGKLTATYSELRQELQTEQLNAAKLCERCNTATNEMTVLQVFQSKEADYRNLIRAGLADGPTVLEDCNRQLIQAAKARKTTPKAQDNETAADLARLHQEQIELQSELTKLRHTQDETALQRPVAPQVVVVTNEVRIERLVPVSTPASPPRIQYVTNTVAVPAINVADATSNLKSNSSAKVKTEALATNSATATERNEASARHQLNSVDISTTNSGMLAGEVKSNTKATNSPNILGPNPMKPSFHMNRAVLFGGGGVILAGFAWLASLMMLGRTHVLQLAQDTKSPDVFTITTREDVLVLGSEPHVEHCSQAGGKPSIRPTWRGTLLVPGEGAVTVNDAPIQKPRRLRPGDRVTATNGDNKSNTFHFLGCDQVNEATGA